VRVHVGDGRDANARRLDDVDGMDADARTVVARYTFLGMWIVMMVAMMLPSLVPMLWRYREAVGMKGETRLGRLTALVGVGYFLVWVDLPGRSCFKDVPLRSQTFRSRGPDSLVTQGEPALEIGRVS
jgi:hypothetical protein